MIHLYFMTMKYEHLTVKMFMHGTVLIYTDMEHFYLLHYVACNGTHYGCHRQKLVNNRISFCYGLTTIIIVIIITITRTIMLCSPYLSFMSLPRPPLIYQQHHHSHHHQHFHYVFASNVVFAFTNPVFLHDISFYTLILII